MSYDVDTGAFTLSMREASQTPYFEQTFRPQDIVTSASNAFVTVYERDGDRLVLTKANDPDLALQYVASAGWSTDDALPVLGTTYTHNRGFTVFGFEAPAANMPNAGNATYSLKIFGTLIEPGLETPLSGTGSLTADFDSGLLQMTMAIDKTVGGIATPWDTVTGVAFVGGNGFAGQLSRGSHTTPFYGGFYGPNAQEVGGSFAFSQNSPEEHAIGNFVGKTSTPAPAPSGSNTTLTNLQVSETFPGFSAMSLDNSVLLAVEGSGERVRYDASTDSFLISVPTRTSATIYSSLSLALVDDSMLNSGLSTASAAIYDLADPTGGAPDRYTRFIPGSSPYALSYVAIGVWENDDLLGGTIARHSVYGFLTPRTALPTTGTATYSIRSLGSYNGAGVALVTGTGSLVTHFASSQVEVDLDLAHGGSHWLSFSEAGPASFSSDVNRIFSLPLVSTDDPTFVGSLSAGHFGPTGENIGGSYAVGNPSSMGISEVSGGAFVGTKVP